MARLPDLKALVEVLRSGNLRARMRSGREGLIGIRLHLVAAAIDMGLLDSLAEGPAGTEELAGHLGVVDRDLLVACLRMLAAAGVVTDDGSWRLTRFGYAVVDDDVVRASYEGFGGFHTELYRNLPELLRGGPRRRDTAQHGEVIARLAAATNPLIRSLLVRTVTAHQPRRVLDIGCGAGLHLAAMLAAAPAATGIGVEVDPDAAALARRTLSERGLNGRARIETADLHTALAVDYPETVDLALLANVIYYVPVDERVELLRTIARLLTPGGTLVIVTTMAAPRLFSRHLDLLLRAQEGRMELPAVDQLRDQLREAGLQPSPPQWLGPRAAALGAVTALRWRWSSLARLNHGGHDLGGGCTQGNT